MEKKNKLMNYWPLGIVFLAILSIIIMTVIALGTMNKRHDESIKAQQISDEWYGYQNTEEDK